MFGYALILRVVGKHGEVWCEYCPGIKTPLTLFIKYIKLPEVAAKVPESAIEKLRL